METLASTVDRWCGNIRTRFERHRLHQRAWRVSRSGKGNSFSSSELLACLELMLSLSNPKDGRFPSCEETLRFICRCFVDADKTGFGPLSTRDGDIYGYYVPDLLDKNLDGEKVIISPVSNPESAAGRVIVLERRQDHLMLGLDVLGTREVRPKSSPNLNLASIKHRVKKLITSINAKKGDPLSQDDKDLLRELTEEASLQGSGDVHTVDGKKWARLVGLKENKRLVLMGYQPTFSGRALWLDTETADEVRLTRAHVSRINTIKNDMQRILDSSGGLLLQILLFPLFLYMRSSIRDVQNSSVRMQQDHSLHIASLVCMRGIAERGGDIDS